MRNTNSPSPPEEYGWYNDECERKKERGKRIFFALTGIALILVGISGLVGVFTVDETIYEISIHENAPPTPLPPPELPAPIAPHPANEVIVEFDERINEAAINAGDSALKTQVSLNSVKDIFINASAADLSILGYSGAELDISINASSGVKYHVESDESSVTINDNGGSGIVLGKQAASIILYVPFDYDENLKADLSAGNMDISNIKGNKLELNLAVGSINMNELDFGEFICEVSAGEISGEDLSFDELDVEAGSGRISLSGALGSTDCEISAGAAVLDYDIMPDYINLRGALSSVDIYLPDDAKFKLNSSTQMGSLSSDFQSHDVDAQINADISMGSITLHKK